MAEPRLSFNRFQLVNDSVAITVNHIHCVFDGRRTRMSMLRSRLPITRTALGVNVSGIVTNRVLLSAVAGVNEMSSVELFPHPISTT